MPAPTITMAGSRQPAREDIAAGHRALRLLGQLAGGTTAAQAAPQLKMIKGNKAERGQLPDILGVCGILCTTRHPGYADGFVPYARRALPSRRFVFAHYPVCWWTAQDGVKFTGDLAGRRPIFQPRRGVPGWADDACSAG